MRSPAWGEVALGSCDLERIDAVTALVVSENWEKQPHNSDYMYAFLCAAQCTHVSYVYSRFLHLIYLIICMSCFAYIPSYSQHFVTYSTQVPWFQNRQLVSTCLWVSLLTAGSCLRYQANCLEFLNCLFPTEERAVIYVVFIIPFLPISAILGCHAFRLARPSNSRACSSCIRLSTHPKLYLLFTPLCIYFAVSSCFKKISSLAASANFLNIKQACSFALSSSMFLQSLKASCGSQDLVYGSMKHRMQWHPNTQRSKGFFFTLNVLDLYNIYYCTSH